MIQNGELLLAFLYISRYENGNSPQLKNKTVIEKFFSNAVTFIDIDKADKVENRAIEIMECGVK
jgi:hypothetical protein